MPIFSRMAASWISLSFLYLVLALSPLKCNILYLNNKTCSKLNATKQVHGVWQSQHVNLFSWRCLMLLHLASPLISSRTVQYGALHAVLILVDRGVSVSAHDTCGCLVPRLFMSDRMCVCRWSQLVKWMPVLTLLCCAVKRHRTHSYLDIHIHLVMCIMAWVFLMGN